MICSQHTEKYVGTYVSHLAKHDSENSGQKLFKSGQFSSPPLQIHAVMSIVDECRRVRMNLSLAPARGQ